MSSVKLDTFFYSPFRLPTSSFILPPSSFIPQHSMDSFRLCLALAPVGVYLLLLGTVNLFRRPRLISGGRDAAGLAASIAGLLVVGPVEFFLPEATLCADGPYLWVMILSLYGLCASMAVLMLPPRLIIYNVAPDKLRPILAEIVERLNAARHAGPATAWRCRAWACNSPSIIFGRCGTSRSNRWEAVKIISAGEGWKRS